MKINKEIKFRGKRVDKNEWIYGYLLKADYGLAICEDLSKTSLLYVDEETIGQYTGLKDKNGVEIYEGDIVQWTDIKMEIFYGEDIGIGYGFCWRPYGENQFYHESMTGFIDEYEVIGNVYDKEKICV